MPFSPPRWIGGDTLLFAATGLVVASVAPIGVALLRDAGWPTFCGFDPAVLQTPGPVRRP